MAGVLLESVWGFSARALDEAHSYRLEPAVTPRADAQGWPSLRGRKLYY